MRPQVNISLPRPCQDILVMTLKMLRAYNFRPCSVHKFPHGDIYVPTVLSMVSPTNHHRSCQRRSNISIAASLSAAITVTLRQYKARYFQVVDALIRSEMFSQSADNKKAGSYAYT
jgi:hypothetical protein